jgi:hypothetical protein
MVTSKDYVVGAKLPPSGIFLKPAAGGWRHAGFNHPFVNALDYDPADPGTLYVAAGNGLIRVRNRGERWKVLTGSDVTELLDVADRQAPGTVYFSHTAGIRVKAATAAPIHAGDSRDSRKSGVLVAGNEEGIFRSEDAGNPGGPPALPGAAHRAIAARCLLLMAGHAVRRAVRIHLRRHLESAEFGTGRNLSTLLDPASPGRVAVADGSRSRCSRLGKPGSRATPGCHRAKVERCVDPATPAASTRAYTRKHSTSAGLWQDVTRTAPMAAASFA